MEILCTCFWQQGIPFQQETKTVEVNPGKWGEAQPHTKEGGWGIKKHPYYRFQLWLGHLYSPTMPGTKINKHIGFYQAYKYACPMELLASKHEAQKKFTGFYSLLVLLELPKAIPYPSQMNQALEQA